MRSVLVVEDCPLVRHALTQLLTTSIEQTVVHEVEDGLQALVTVRQHSFDLAILDGTLCGRTDGDLIGDLKRAGKDMKLLVLMAPPDTPYAFPIQTDGDGYLRKKANPHEVVRAVRTMLDGEDFDGDPVAQEWARVQTMKPPHAALSWREYQVFESLVAGKALPEIAEQLHVNEAAVSTYRARILEKTKVKSTAELVRYAIEHRLVL